MTINISLLPFRKESSCHFKLQMLISLTVVGLVLLLWHLILQNDINGLTKRVIDLQKELVGDDGEVGEQQGRAKIMNNVGVLEKRRDRFVGMLQGILQGVSKDLYLEQLLIKNNEVKIVGQIGSIFSLMEYVKRLINLGRKDVPTIKKIERKKDGYGFLLLWQYE